MTTPVIIALPQSDFLDLLDRLLPASYLDPLKETGASGYELLQAYGAMAARASIAVQHLGEDSYIGSATGGSFATGTVQLYRDRPAPAGDLIAGQIGTTASIVAGAPVGQARVTGLTGMTAASVGRFLVMANTAFVVNTGGFKIMGLNSPTSVDVRNAVAVVPDTNNGAIAWQEEYRDLVVKAGSVVTTSNGGRDYVTQADVPFAADDLGPFDVAVTAVAAGYEWNVPGQVTAGDGSLLEGDIDTMRRLVEDPHMLDLAIKVRNVAATSGGRDGALDSLGSDRGIERLAGELDTIYRRRVRQLPDTISPNAVLRAVTDALAPYGASFKFIETFHLTYQTCFDAPSAVIAGSLFDPDLFCYDDPRDPDVFRNRWLSENDYRGAFIVVVDNVQPLLDLGMIMDDNAPHDPADYASIQSGGTRSYSAWDAPASFAFGTVGAWGGDDYRKNSFYLGLYDILRAIKAAGVGSAVELKGE